LEGQFQEELALKKKLYEIQDKIDANNIMITGKVDPLEVEALEKLNESFQN